MSRRAVAFFFSSPLYSAHSTVLTPVRNKQRLNKTTQKMTEWLTSRSVHKKIDGLRGKEEDSIHRGYPGVMYAVSVSAEEGKSDVILVQKHLNSTDNGQTDR